MTNKFYFILFFIVSILSADQAKALLSQKGLHDRPGEYERGIFLIVLSNQSQENFLTLSTGGDFLEFKKSQGYDVDVVSLDQLNIDSNNGLKGYLQSYKNTNPLLEYVLLVGDWNGSYAVPTFTIPSYNEDQLDVTDYAYTYIGDDVRNPRFFIGRWPVRTTADLLNLKSRTISYTRLEEVEDDTHFDNALIVAGNFKDGQGVQPWQWPVTPVWTSIWLQDKLIDFGYENADTVFYHAQNYENGAYNPMIANTWNNGVGVVNYRGWGDANGWHKPYFHREEVEELYNGWKLPVVLSFVCNTGDFGNDYSGVGLDKCFGETLITAGSVTNPKGAVAMVGPSDLDTDTRFNNVICSAMWDELLEGRHSELAPALHAGKDSVRTQFDNLIINNTNIPNFYYHIYGVLGDPSISLRMSQPDNFEYTINPNLNDSHLSIQIFDNSGQPIRDVVGALMYDDNLIGKDLSTQDGWLDIDFDGSTVPLSSDIYLYLNHQDFYQEKISLIFNAENQNSFEEHSYIAEEEIFADYIYEINLDDGYEWVELDPDLGGNGINLCLTDDSVTDLPLEFDFNYYGNSYNSMTVSSNGWASFEDCDIPYFWNFSIPFPLGPSAMLAPFMDDLDDNGKEPFSDLNGNCIHDEGETFVDRNDNGQWDSGEDFDVYYLYDSDNGRLIIQWNNVSNGEDDEICPDCVKETFQLVLLDQDIYSNVVNQGDIIFLYKEIHDIDENGNFSTIGIESPDQNFGTQLLFSGNSPDIISILNDGYSIRFSAGSNPLEANELNQPEFSLLKTYPNPFNPSLTINYSLINSSDVKIDIYDIKGTFIETILNKRLSAGSYANFWIPKGLASGSYIINLNINEKSYSNKVILLK
ncbi:C25 family cysteine peptidase [Candidatus Marinimicrobia bacterium]|nr:C25 family cysteine peptidase [Candidatus Neomarinimicrobiota bacterium]